MLVFSLKDLIVIIQKLEVIKFIHFGGGGGGEIRVLKQKLQNLRHDTFGLSFPAILLVNLNKPWNLIGCFILSVTLSLAGQKMRFRAKNAAIRE